ncbi:DegT/DnrJ/EryC1/StrS family aminotransferase [Lamprobacter modestohalophilus]|uniref:DegT/DnrJ/EryC1/StrS family aminotransferase n=1 Tax=Lamprobacter modestohalophilus TaxID=1064514 RepID=UPI002ADED9DF|nr:DegT/DnrJ/EryC1/StrS family aminotransferase [Lamprobacter modestohalophilus]MEA1052769.1 DegT/DnrJ/EryC1/StrS family aminotransferase [Lamprobacter modestohalophilus]
MPNAPIYVTMPALAPLEEFNTLLQGVWERGILTHNGPLVQQFERALSAKLQLPGFVATTNGTIALQMAIKALKLQGEIITTPFTWIATISAIQWEHCTPIFADIDPHTLNIDPGSIEQRITDRTVAIMPVHVFGNPCDVEAIQTLADHYGLKVIYDAAHAIGSTYNGNSLLTQGDISATSLHATKLLNTGEGGGCITKNPALQESLKRIRFFGHNEQRDIVEEGFNGKMTEIHAALGLANLTYFDDVLADRKSKYARYKEAFSAHPHIRLQKLQFGETNYSYFPIIFDREEALLDAVARLEAAQIYARRYFYPSVNTFKKILADQQAPISEEIARRILCLPLYHRLTEQAIDRVIRMIGS